MEKSNNYLFYKISSKYSNSEAALDLTCSFIVIPIWFNWTAPPDNDEIFPRILPSDIVKFPDDSIDSLIVDDGLVDSLVEY